MNEAEIWQSDSEWIKKEMGAQITQRKIRKLFFKHNGKVMVAEVGKPNPYNELPIGKIYEAPGSFFICGGTITIAPKDSLVEDY